MDSAARFRSFPHLPSALAFVAIGLAIYAALSIGAEWLVWRNGHMNPLFKVERSASGQDWVILGASHAMPLDFDDFNDEMEDATGLRILNLAGPGTGPLYNRFVLEHFLSTRTTRDVLYVIDAFAFRSPVWNEDRLSDPGLLARTPFSMALAARLAHYVRAENVDARALLDYATGFSKLNDRERFATDQWEGEAQFDRVFRPSASADRKRMDYLYPPVASVDAHQERYFSTLAELVKSARTAGAAVTLAKFPLPSRFRGLLPKEADFDARLARFAVEHAVPLHDFSSAIEGEEFYADTDHLNRAGVRRLFEDHLRHVLGQGMAQSARACSGEVESLRVAYMRQDKAGP
jgi:hypothetical protein